jgi:hypothetical protein
MTVEIKSDLSRTAATAERVQQALRQGENRGWAQKPRADHETEGDLAVFPPVAPPRVSWPRVFPGI